MVSLLLCGQADDLFPGGPVAPSPKWVIFANDMTETINRGPRRGLVNGFLIRHDRLMIRVILIYAGVLGMAAFALQWLQYHYVTKVFAPEFYVALIGVGFTALGLWVGRALTPARRSTEFAVNAAALNTLGITAREYAVLEQLAVGLSNKQIADTLHVSPNTVKTHVSRLYEKLEVGQRVQAVQKAKDLQLIP